MAKRVRGSVRPGQRRPTERRPTTATTGAAPAASGAAPAAALRSTGLTEAETKRAAELEAALLAEERAADVARKRVQGRATREIGVGGGTLAVRAQEEYAYVGRDVRRIVRVMALLLTILLVLWVLVDVAKVFPVS